MTVRQLAELLTRRIDSGAVDPDAVVVRPFCHCDEDTGYVEATFVDEVVRAWSDAPNVEGSGRVYRYGQAAPGDDSVATIKLA